MKSEHRSDTYKEFVALYEGKVLSTLTDRHSVVHTFTLKAKHWWGAIEHGGDKGKLEALEAEKSVYPNVFREQLQYMFKGFELVLKLASELPDKDIIDRFEK